MNYGISCDPGSKNASPAVWCRRLKCGACTCNSTGKRHSRSWPESAIQNRPQRRRAADPAQRSLSDVVANIWKSAMTPNMHKTGTSVYTLRVPACFCADSGGSTAQKRLDGRPSAAEHVAAFNCVRACAAKQSHYTRVSLSIPEKTAKFGKIRVVRMQKPFCAEKNRLCRVFRCRRGPVCFVRFTPKRFVFRRGFVPCAIRNLRAVSPILSVF